MNRFYWLSVFVGICFCLSATRFAQADGKLVPPRDYAGSLEERAQEAIIIFRGGDGTTSASEQLILKISATGDAKEFAWVVPFPTVPVIKQESAELFAELFKYVEQRRFESRTKSRDEHAKGETAAKDTTAAVDVIKREVVGNYEIATVRENAAGKLNVWLVDNGYQRLDGAEDVLEFYRRKGYVFACIKVSAAALTGDKAVDLHPLRFQFDTGGRDGIYFPMRMTGLQSEPFDVNLYVFTGKWLNDELNRFGYQFDRDKQPFRLNFRDYDGPQCTPNEGKLYSAPRNDPYLQAYADKLTATAKIFAQIAPAERFYLTNIQAVGLKPREVRAWADDLWLFPYYNDRKFVPYDARPKEAAHEGYRNVAMSAAGELSEPRDMSAPGEKPSASFWSSKSWGPALWFLGAAGAMFVIVLAALRIFRRPAETKLRL